MGKARATPSSLLCTKAAASAPTTIAVAAVTIAT